MFESKNPECMALNTYVCDLDVGGPNGIEAASCDDNGLHLCFISFIQHIVIPFVVVSQQEYILDCWDH